MPGLLTKEGKIQRVRVIVYFAKVWEIFIRKRIKVVTMIPIITIGTTIHTI